jgi:hypothetical protein
MKLQCHTRLPIARLLSNKVLRFASNLPESNDPKRNVQEEEADQDHAHNELIR